MRKILLALFLLTAGSGFAQYLEISGKIVWYDLKPEKGKLYYTRTGEQFSAQKFIWYDAQAHYTFKIKLKEIMEQHITDIVFSLDTISKPTDEYACVQRVHVNEIVYDSLFKKAKDIKIVSDLVMDFNCSSSVAYGAEQEGKQHWLGNYSLQHGDTTFSITLGDMFFRYRATLSIAADNYMNSHFGSWEYDGKNGTLTFYIWYLQNQRFGIMAEKRRAISFKVTEAGREFTNGGMVLKRL